MAAPMKSGHLSKSQKKAAKKQQKNRHTLFKRNQIIPVDFATHHLVVANGGLDNNVTCDELNDVFSAYGEVIDIVMQPQKSYAFVSMSSAGEAEAAFSGAHGKPLVRREEGASDVVLYLDYVESVPGIAVPSDRHPPGLILVENFVSEEEEELLVDAVRWDQLDAHLSTDGIMKHRRVKHYGFEFIYGINNVDRNRPLEHDIPRECDVVTDRLLNAGHINVLPDQLTVNQYEPGQGIPPHVDTHSAFEDNLVALSLGSQCVMDFKHPDGRFLSVLLPRRSILVMTGESRYQWTHGITPRKSDIVRASSGENQARLTLVKRGTRTSFTFRKIRSGPCACKYPEQCDSQQSKNTEDNKEKKTVLQLPKSDQEAERIEKEHVHEVYEEIATHFSDTRHSAWPQVAEFLNQQPEGATIMDVGCGNGKYLGVNKACLNVGCDRSANLCTICCERGFPVFVADVLHLPLRSNMADVAISIAVIHHLSTQERRRRAVEEIVRILRPGGQALIYVWALEQEKDKVKSNYLKDTRIRRKDCLKSEEEKMLREVSGITLSSDSGSSSLKGQPVEDLTPPVVDRGTSVDSQDQQECSAKTQDDDEVGASVRGETPLGGATCCHGDQTEPLDGARSSGGTPVAVRSLAVHVNRTHFEDQDLLVPWHSMPKQKKVASASPIEKKDKVVHRFYHVFQEGELEKLCLAVTGVQLIKRYYDKGNWCVIIQKTGS